MSEQEWEPGKDSPLDHGDATAIKMLRGLTFIGMAIKCPDGRWEVHPEPVESGPWGYRATADEAIALLIGEGQGNE